MNQPQVDSAATQRTRERVCVSETIPLTNRWIGAVAVLGAACWAIVLLARRHHHPGWHDSGRLGWSLAILAAVALIARGIFLGRPVTTAHAGAAGVAAVLGLGLHVLSFDLLGDVLIASSGLVSDVADVISSATRRPAPSVGPDQGHYR